MRANRKSRYKTRAILVWAAVMMVGGLMVYELLNTQLAVTGQGLRTIPAADQKQLFEEQMSKARLDAFPGMVYTVPSEAAAEDHLYRIYTLRLKNTGLLPAEMVECSVYPIEGDVLMYPLKDAVTIMPGQSCDVSFVMLSASGGADARDIRVTYYLWGNMCSVRFVYR